MAIYHLSMKPITRSSGRSAVAASAYRAGECLTNERDGLTHDYTRKSGIEHAEIVLPKGSTAEWARDRSALWNAAEAAEKRSDARVAREFEIALPHELSPEERLEATRAFAQVLADRYGTAVDFAVHSPNGETDIRNHHAHLMMSVRGLTETGLGEKTILERENGWLLSRALPTSMMQLKDIRRDWEGIANEGLAQAGHDIRIDHRSHQDRGLEIEPTEHMGVYATQMERRGMAVVRQRIDQRSAQSNAALIREKPEQVLSVITSEKSVFGRHDVARALHRYIDQPEAFQNAFTKVMASPALIELKPEARAEDCAITLARYSTREMVETERGMAANAREMAGRADHAVDRRHLDAALSAFDRSIRVSAEQSLAKAVRAGEIGQGEKEAMIASSGLGDEQRRAVRHITGDEGIAVVIGLAGAGKSTMLGAARQAWESQGYRVLGAALAGKAAEGLQESSGIRSRTLASYEHGWQNGQGKLGPRDVLVIDEAGMIGSRQLARFVSEAHQSGAKLVMVGDPEQLQAIGAGAPFRTIAERVGFVELTEIRRQQEDWQRDASRAFARGGTAEALAAYDQHGMVRFHEGQGDARAAIVRGYIEDTRANPDASRIALAHRRADVRALNEAIRSARQERGELPKGEEAGERRFQTNDGERAFAPGDRVVFLENNRDLQVKNGMLGTVREVSEGRLVAQLDGKGRDGRDRIISVPTESYRAIDHGYATTIHKTQGATVDKAFVLASKTMDRHLAYVAMTRHRQGVELHASREEFKDGMEGLSKSFSRDGAKETTLDYEIRDFAERRGIRVPEAIGRMVAKAFETLRLPKPAFVERMAPAAMAGKDGREKGEHQGVGRSGEPGRVPAASLQHDHSGFDAARPKAATQDRNDTPAGSRGDGRGRETIGGASEGKTGGNPQRLRPDLASRQEKPLGTGANREAEKGMETSEDGSTRRQSPERGKVPSFEGLKLPMRQKPATLQERLSERAEHPKTEGRGEQPDQTRATVLKALERHADAIADAARMKGLGLPVVAHQRVALEKSEGALEQVKPGTAKLLQSAHRYDAEAKRVIEGEKAPDRPEKLLEAAEREGRAQQDPAIRAGRYSERWTALQAEEKAAGRSASKEQREEFAAGRKALATEIGGDPEAARKLAQDPESHGFGPKSPIVEALRSGKTGKAFTEELERRERAQDQGHER
ncbi:MAG: Ti-type conjugative transfer relaxase TraA [Beijerinckiaceae bacterium]|nr:Ti-type conjugative transfer relaxase TraA [Beijerinckiaceae bacterium]